MFHLFQVSDQAAIAQQLLTLVADVVLNDEALFRAAMEDGLVQALTRVISCAWSGSVVEPVCSALVRTLNMCQWFVSHIEYYH